MLLVEDLAVQIFFTGSMIRMFQWRSVDWASLDVALPALATSIAAQSSEANTAPINHGIIANESANNQLRQR